VIAAFHNGTISAADVDALPVGQVGLQEIFDYLNDPDKTDPMPVPDIIDFLKNQVIMTVSKNGTAETNATYFPIIPDLSVSLPAFDSQIALDYAFASYNTLSATYIHELKEYFNQFAVQLDSEQDTGDLMKARVKVQNAAESMATFIFADYFLLLARQMVQNALDALSTFHYPIVAGQTVQQITGWINTHGQFGSGYVYTVSDLFENNKSHVLTPAAIIKVRMATYSTVSDDTFNTITAKAIYNKGFAGKGLATVNAANTTILQNGISISYTGKDDIIIQAGNSLNSLAKDFGVTPDQLLDNAKVQGNSILDSKGLLMPSSKLMLPDFNGQTQPADTLITFSARYGVTVDTLAATPENAAIVNLFDSADNDGQLIISDLPQFEVGELIKEIQGNKGLQQLSGMASRYYLSGLRLPTDGITPNFQGMWVTKDNDKKLIYEEYNAGLFALTGQQFPIPVLKPDTSYAILFTLPTPLSWIAFEGNVNTAEMPVVQKSDAYTQVQAVRNYAQQNVLDLAIEQLGAGDMFSGNYGHYSFSTVGLWQAGSPILLPYSGVINSAQTLSIWTLPNDLLGLAVPNGRAITPRFQVQIGTVDPATQSIKSQPVTNYGWGTQVTFTIKRVPLSADSSVSRDTYEISGADGNNALILEQMVTYLNNNDSLVYLMAFGFTPNQSSGSNPGIQTDPISSLTIGIAQANLSTFTRPDNEAMKLFTETLKVQSDESNLLNNPSALVTLLWQASITRDGGYYLYYYNTENGEGLPDHAFNDKGEAVLSLITLYSMPANSNEQNLLQPCMNMFVTGDPVNVNDSTLYAQADPLSQKATFKSDDTLTGIAFNYFANIGDVAEDNATAVLTAALTIAVPEGTYQVKTAGGETLQSIADKFGTTVLAIKDANKVVTNWPDPLPFYFSLRLPSLTAKAGSNVNTGTLLAISSFYGMDITALANYNSNTVGLFAAGTQLTMTGGPVTRVATVPAGVVSLEAIRKEPAAIPPKPTDPNYALLFLQHNFSILSFKLVNNSWFETKEPFLSLPAGPTEPQPDPNNAYLGVEDLSDKWIFKQSVPYYKFANQPAKLVAGMPDISTSPYKGIGYLVQADFMWLDIYGNTILTTLSQPSAGNIINESPILTGYTDALLGVNQWPSVSTVWQVAGGSQPAIQVPLSFDTTQYNGLLTAKAVNSTTISLTFTEALDATTAAVMTNYKLSPDLKIVSAVLKDAKTVELTVAAMAEDMKYTLGIGNIQNSAKTITFNGQATFSFPDTAVAASSSIVQQATHDFQVYEQIWYQLTDPNGISMSMQTSLFDHDFPVDSSVFDDLVNKWISSIYLYLQDRSQGGITVAAPANTYTLKFNINPTGVNPAQIFEVVLSLSIARTGGAVMGDFETTGSVKQVTTLLSPSTDAPVNTSRSLDVFADAFEEAMSVTDQYYLKICTGADRDKSGQQKPDGTIWAARLGIDDAQPIAYSVVSPGEPDLFAPQPVSNKLESRTGVNIYTYSTGTGIDFNKPAYQKDFTEIDMDKWVSSFFGSMDNILTPEFTASIQLIDKKLNTSYLKDIQNSKESLADIAKMLMVTVFENETADARPVQEALKQALLAKLSNLYATNSGILFDVKVKADPAAGIAPNLYGSLLQNTVLEGAVSDDEHLRTVTLHFSAPLDKTTATDINNYTLTSPLTVQFAVLSTDGRSVILTASADVSIDFTTVITGEAILDANNRPVRGDKKATVSTNYVSYAKSDQLTITAAKIKLDKSTDQSLAFLLSTPEIVRGQDGEVLSKINLNLSYCGTNIEHQVAVPVNGFTPSSWLSFVLPNVRVPLESQLGGFPVPMFLRSFPQNPSLVNQSGTAPDTNNPDISKLLNWDYSFHYSEPFYYPQDILNFTVNFNVGGAGLLVPNALTDAFSQLAEFVTVYPSVDVDIKALVTQIDAKKYYDSQSTKLFTDAGIAMKSFTEMVRRIVDAASGANGLILNSMPHAFASMGSAAPYSFEVREAPRGLNGKQVQVVTIHGQPPAGVGIPKVLIEPGTYKEMLWTSTDDPCGEGNICYYYVNRETGEPLLSKEAQSIQSRQLVLPELNILQRQDALTTVYLTRNEDLIHDKKTNPAFVYTTGNLSFSNPYLPTITSLQEIEIADLPANNKIPATRTLFDQLKTLMDTLLKENTEPSLSFQVTGSYDYAININLFPVNLPVFMQTMVSIELDTKLDPMLQSWTDNINQWFSNNNPNRVEGALRFDLVIFSNLTQQPYPLVRLPGLVLSLEYILPAPGSA
jgi:LysM repeat protein